MSNTDSPADHGTEEFCERCTGIGCSEIAESLQLTVTVTVRRSQGTAASTEAILLGLQEAITDLTAIEIGTEVSIGKTTVEEIGEYAIEAVDYTLPARSTEAGT